MGRKIIWTDPARLDFDNIIAYLQEAWSPEIAIRFINNLYEVLDRVERQPESGRRSKTYDDVRRILIDKHNALYYSVLPDALYLLRIIDTRSNPTANPFDQ